MTARLLASRPGSPGGSLQGPNQRTRTSCTLILPFTPIFARALDGRCWRPSSRWRSPLLSWRRMWQQQLDQLAGAGGHNHQYDPFRQDEVPAPCRAGLRCLSPLHLQAVQDRSVLRGAVPSQAGHAQGGAGRRLRLPRGGARAHRRAVEQDPLQIAESTPGPADEIPCSGGGTAAGQRESELDPVGQLTDRSGQPGERPGWSEHQGPGSGERRRLIRPAVDWRRS